MMNIAIYMRLSKEDEFSHVESNSISMQRYLLMDYAREHFPDAKIYEFSDDGYSGTNFDRPGIQELLDRVKNYEINCIIVKDFSRFARDYIELGSYLEQIFPFMGVRFISINDKYDSDQYGGSIADIDINFKNLLYDLYSKDLSVKVKASMRAIKEQGKFVGSEPPFGYKKDPKDRHQFLIEEDEAEIIRRMFDMYADGMSSVEIAKIFNQEGVKTPAQIRTEKGVRKREVKGGIYVWQHTSMIRMLKNRSYIGGSYIGDLVQGTYECHKLRGDKRVTDPEKWIIYENHHEPIVDREVFEQVQKRFGSGKRTWKRKDKHVLVGRVVCGCCGRNLRHNVKGHHYYWCAGLNTNNLDSCVKRIEDFFLEEVILFQLQQHIMELGEMDGLLQQEKEDAAALVEKLKKECQSVEKAVEDAKEKRMADYEAYALGRLESYDGSREAEMQLKEKLDGLRQELLEAEETARQLQRKESCEAFAVTKLTSELMDQYIENVAVYSDDDVRITWK